MFLIIFCDLADLFFPAIPPAMNQINPIIQDNLIVTQ